MRHVASLRKFLALICCVAAATAGVSAASAQEAPPDGKLTTAISKLADDLHVYLKNDAQVNELTIGSFTAAQADLAPNFGLAIKKMLTDELIKREVVVRPLGTKFSCKGEFTFFADAGKVTIDTVLREGAFTRKKYSEDIFEVSDIVALMGGTGKLSPESSEQRQKDATLAIEQAKPQVEEIAVEPAKPAASGNVADAKVEDTTPTSIQIEPAASPKIPARVTAAKDADYAMEIWRVRSDRLGAPDLTEADFEPVPIETLDKGLLLAGLELGDVYAVRLINNTDRLAAVALTIDGLNMFAFSTDGGYRELGKVLVPPGPKGVLIKGWHHDNIKSFSFEVGDVGDSAIAEVQGSSLTIDEQIGVITARFAVAVDLAKGESFPADEAVLSQSLGTKKGPLVDQTYRDMQVKIGVDREVISIRYARLLPDA